VSEDEFLVLQMTDRLETSYSIGKTILKNPGSLNAVITCCKHEKAASRYNFDFLLHAAQTAFRITLGMPESSALIAVWQLEQSAASASRIASFPCGYSWRKNEL
jgi:hypothetical protein